MPKVKLNLTVANIKSADLLMEKISKTIKKTRNAKVKKDLERSLQKVVNIRMFHAKESAKDCYLQERAYSPWRDLTEIEKKADFAFLNASYNGLEAEFDEAISAAAQEDLQKSIKKVEGKIKAGDVAAIAAMSFLNFNRIQAIISEYTKKSFEVGKKTASDEMKVERPVTPTIKTQLNNFTSAQIADDFVTQVNSEAKKNIKFGLAKGAATAAIVSTIAGIVKDETSSFINQAVGNVVGDALNDGRRLVFEKNITEIQGYLRSEILDNRTCFTCEQLDGSEVLANDAMAQLDQVHDNCRGIWIPILNDEEASGDWGIPDKLRNSFDTENRYGIPHKNEYTPFKKELHPDGPGAELKPDAPEFRPPSEIKKAVPINDVEYAISADAEAAQEDVQNGAISRTPGPILVTQKEEGGYQIIDGAHRLEAARLAGKKNIDIRVVDPNDAKTYGTKEFNKLMRPALTGADLKAYNALPTDAQDLYDKIRIDGGLAHTKAIKEAQDIAKWKDFAAKKDPLGGFESAFPERKRQGIIIDEIIKRNKK